MTVDGIPWSWIWLGALASFAFISTGLLRLDEWLERRQVQGKQVLVVIKVENPTLADELMDKGDQS